MDVKDIIFGELIKKGYSESEGKKVWNMANRSFLHLTEDLSKGFLSLRNFELYKKNIFDKELKLIRDHTDEFIAKIGTDEPFNLIDIGCGGGAKAKEFIQALKGRVKIRYCPVSPDEYLINIAIKNIKKEKFENVVSYAPYVSDFESLAKISPIMRTNEFQKNVILLHGSILASYEINDYLFTLSRGMFAKDFIIIGNGIRTGERLVNLSAYKHKIFSDWFIHLVRAAGFKDNEVEYDVRFGNSRIEGFYRVKKEKKIRHNKKEIVFREGDEILVAILYKYFLKELDKFFKMYFSDVHIVKDPKDEYILALCKK